MRKTFHYNNITLGKLHACVKVTHQTRCSVASQIKRAGSNWPVLRIITIFVPWFQNVKFHFTFYSYLERWPTLCPSEWNQGKTQPTGNRDFWSWREVGRGRDSRRKRQRSNSSTEGEDLWLSSYMIMMYLCPKDLHLQFQSQASSYLPFIPTKS